MLIPDYLTEEPRAYNTLMPDKSIADLRQNYTLKRLEPNTLNPDPIEQFRVWLDEAIEAELLEPNAMTLATVNGRGQPSARIVLLKGLDERGFVFYSNYESDKAQDMAENSNVALVFNWLGLERQVRIRGEVSKVSREASLAYFKSRPHASQLGAWASHQSRVIEKREVLEKRLAELQEEYEEGEVPLPEFWGGYVVTPFAVEFWQGRPSRLHDRFLYTRKGEAWQIKRLSP